ncbi:class I SAM-dependent methyltransferase [Sphingobacterium faecale]|uniref:Class I SAM-dependent methyltransferase n=1 Tax=Sphingobacterium faecale TaxID=2803775 RepID=A0ABS1R5T4_9SPHI|nr:class I SAM-dependent methyltransferase [Sphingobacterium faecale]MBL1409357.1 class I SAM-dependent methyltransferase [Sphingobacterium faecale]
MKDNFSNISDKYAKFRPTYPQTIYDFIYPLLSQRDIAWDCGTGTGQVALELAKDFNKVYATDISAQQLEHAPHADNIIYTVQRAEQTVFPANSFDLITVAQAVHWFDFDKFNEEVKRVGRPNSIIALFGYELINITPEIDAIIKNLYTHIVGSYWDPERKHIEQQYQTIPFPYRELETPEITNIKLWNIDALLGYLQTWSAVQHYEKDKGSSPVKAIEHELRKVWGTLEVRKVSFPIIFRVGRIK